MLRITKICMEFYFEGFNQRGSFFSIISHNAMTTIATVSSTQCMVFFSLCGSQLVMLIQRMRTYRLFFFCRSVFSCFLKCWDHHICNGTKKIALFRRSRDFKHFFLQRNVFLNCVGVSQVNGLDIGWYVDVITRLTTGNVSTKFFFSASL